MAVKPRKPISPEVAQMRLETLCGASERCTYELLTRLKRWGVTASQADKIIDSLAADRYVDDARFARVFARDRVVNYGYGRYRVRALLSLKHISADIIRSALDSIDPDEYDAALTHIVESRVARARDIETWEGRNKVYRAVVARGWESDCVIATLKRVLTRLKHQDDEQPD